MKPTSGTVHFEGNRIDGLPTHEICSRGIIQVPEGRKIFPRMKVVANLEMGAYLPEAKKNFRKTLGEVFALFPLLEQRKKQLAATLSGGEQQMLAIGRALMSRPKLIMFDEPSLGLSPKALGFSVIGKLNWRAHTLLISRCLQTVVGEEGLLAGEQPDRHGRERVRPPAESQGEASLSGDLIIAHCGIEENQNRDRPLSCGSQRSRSPSPRNMNPPTAMAMASPGKVGIHQ
jgi:hypothetical protein